MKRRNLLTAGLLAGCFSTVAAQMTEGLPATRLILVTSGDYFRYQAILSATSRALAGEGVIQHGDVPMPTGTNSTAPLWQWLSQRAGGRRLIFLSDGWYSYDWNGERRKTVREMVLTRLKTRRDVDLIMTFGTDAGFDMARYVDDIPVLNLNSTDPVANGLVKSADDSGKNNVHAMVTGDFWQWQLQRFHAIFRFRHLAVVTAHENLTRSGIDAARDLGPVLGYVLKVQTYQNDQTQPHESFKRFFAAMQNVLDEGADAVYLPWFPADDDEMRQLVKLLTDRRIPSFSQTGADPVRRGLLLGAGDVNYDAVGRFEARVIESVINGVMPRKINQCFTQSQGLVLNLRTAMQMGWQPPLGLLATVEKTYTTQSPEFARYLSATPD